MRNAPRAHSNPLAVVRCAAVVVGASAALWGATALGETAPPADAAAGAEPGKAAGPVDLATAASAAAAPPKAAFGADIMATADKPAGFAYTVMRNAVVDEVQETYLYIKSSEKAVSSVTVPIPKNRELLAKCIAGGGIDDLAHGAIVSVKYDPAGVVKPEIVIVQKVEMEIFDHAKVLDRGGTKLYITTADGGAKGFEVEGGEAAWNTVIEGGTFADLAVGTEVKVEHDPGGRKPIRVVILQKVAAAPAAASGKGCGCDTRGQSPLPWSAAWTAAAILTGLVVRRRWG
jgi:MYXO-CTERM domain-containing protein